MAQMSNSLYLQPGRGGLQRVQPDVGTDIEKDRAGVVRLKRAPFGGHSAVESAPTARNISSVTSAALHRPRGTDRRQRRSRKANEEKKRKAGQT